MFRLLSSVFVQFRLVATKKEGFAGIEREIML